MAGEEAAEGSRGRRRMDLNLYLGLPPLPQPPGRLDVAMDFPASLPSSLDPALEAPRVDEPGGLLPPEEVPPPPAVYSPSNALSTPELSLLDPLILEWFDGHSTDSEEALDAVEPVVGLDVPSDGANVSPQLLAGLEGDDLEPLAERVSHPDRVSAVSGGVVMVTMRELRQSSGVAIEARTPELRLRRLIQVSEQHRIVRSVPVSPDQRATSPEAERLARAIQCSHSSLGASKRQKLDGDGKVGGMVAAKKDECCGCNSSFECNICLETAKEPVVTPCGHLFCWPCLYQWLHGHSAHPECPVCKGEVLEANVTPIYGRGAGERDASSNDVPPRPRANRSESLRQQLQMPDQRGIASMVRRLMENQGIVRGQAAPPAGVEATVLPAGRSRARGRRQQRQDNNALPSVPSILLHVGSVAPGSSNEVPLPSSNADNAALAVPTVPQQSSSMEQASTSSTMSVIVGEPVQSRRSRPSESTTTRRTRRRQQ